MRCLLLFLVVNAGAADFERHMITLPVTVRESRFIDVDNDGRSDLLAADGVEKRLLIYRQRATGFSKAPDQMIDLATPTAWIAPCDVDAHPSLELAMSTAAGIFYHRQNGGVFESERRSLIKADQVFTGDDSPWIFSLATNSTIPVISASEAILYRRNNAFEWTADPPSALNVKRTRWRATRNEWAVGANSSRTMRIQQSFRSQPDDDDEKPENDGIRKVLETIKKANPGRQPHRSRVDVDGDRRKDLVLWHVIGNMDCRTEVFVFLRGADGRLPGDPTQVLRGAGFPIPIGSTEEASPIADLSGDGTCELVLLEMTSSVFSASGVVEMVLSRGVDWALRIRSFNRGVFSGTVEASVPIKSIMPIVSFVSVETEQWPVFICGDFSGDGRPDFVVQRPDTQWTVLFSTGDRRWFAPEPAMTFETPVQGYLEVNELNADGRSDIVLRGFDDPRLFVFISKGRSR